MPAFNAFRRTARKPGPQSSRSADHHRPATPRRDSEADDTLAWFDSSWDLRQGLDVKELEAAPSDWLCLAGTSAQAAGAVHAG